MAGAQQLDEGTLEADKVPGHRFCRGVGWVASFISLIVIVLLMLHRKPGTYRSRYALSMMM